MGTDCGISEHYVEVAKYSTSSLSCFFLCIIKKEVKVTKIQKAWNIVSDGNRHPVERRRDPSPTHKLRKMEKTYKDYQKKREVANESPQVSD